MLLPKARTLIQILGISDAAALANPEKRAGQLDEALEAAEAVEDEDEMLVDGESLVSLRRMKVTSGGEDDAESEAGATVRVVPGARVEMEVTLESR